MQIYQHDNSDAFRFRLIGRLDLEAAAELERCWRSALSVLGSRPLVVSVSEVAGFEETGLSLLRKMRDEGVLFAATEDRARRLRDLLGTQLTIENKPGALTLSRWLFGRR